ncbi:MAG: transporter substrate-binding domain-containing protein [Actinobacteria bacterium]|nr:transporter substrate-binding domain-containing protein [Actinomycetota bacterium]
MRRTALATVLVACVAGALAAWSLAAPAGGTGSSAVQATAKKKLPPLPKEIKEKKKWTVGVKCDTPPFGYIDLKGQNAGYDVEIARWFAQFAFGNRSRVSFECVTTATRIPALTSGKIDLILATMTYTHLREQTVDFSTPYYVATGRLLVPNGSSLRVSNLAGKTITTTGGSIYDRWITKCFKDTKSLLFQSPSLALAALKEGRADAEMFDDSFLLGVATSDPSLRLTPDKFLKLPWGIGIAKGNTAMKKWVDSRLAILKKKNEFLKILKRNVNPTLFDAFKDNVPGPKRTLKYPATEELELACP